MSQHSIPGTQASSYDKAVDIGLDVDYDAQLISGIKAIIESYQDGKEKIHRSGIAEADLVLPQYNG